MSTIIDTPDGIAFAGLAALKTALSLQLKGMKHSRRSATSIGKNSYGIPRNTASGQLPIVEQQIADIFLFRECAPAMQQHLLTVLGNVVNAIDDQPGIVADKRAIDAGIRLEVRYGRVTPAEAEVLRALARIWLFECRVPFEGGRVIFREELFAPTPVCPPSTEFPDHG